MSVDSGVSVRAVAALTTADMPEYFGWNPENAEQVVLEVDRYIPDEDPLKFEKEQNYTVRLVIQQGDLRFYSKPITFSTLIKTRLKLSRRYHELHPSTFFIAQCARHLIYRSRQSSE